MCLGFVFLFTPFLPPILFINYTELLFCFVSALRRMFFWKLMILIQSTSIFLFVYLIFSAVKCFCLLVEIGTFLFKVPCWLTYECYLYLEQPKIVLFWMGRRARRHCMTTADFLGEVTPCSSWMPQDTGNCLALKFTHPHSLSFLEQMSLSVLSSLHLSQWRHTFLTLKMGRTEVQWGEVICSSIPPTTEGNKNKT